MVLETVELGTFGALLRFAIELERQTGEHYKSLASKVHDPSATELFSRYAREYARRLKLLEGLRQQSINEVLLEPISNLDSRLYLFTPDVSDEMGINAVLDAALGVENKVEGFYRDSLREAGPVLGEANRVFRRFLDENREREKVLLALRGTLT